MGWSTEIYMRLTIQGTCQVGPPDCVCHAARLLKFPETLLPERRPPCQEDLRAVLLLLEWGQETDRGSQPRATAASQVARRWQGLTWGRMMVFELSAHTTSTLLLTSTRATWPTDGCRTNDRVESAALQEAQRPKHPGKGAPAVGGRAKP